MARKYPVEKSVAILRLQETNRTEVVLTL